MNRRCVCLSALLWLLCGVSGSARAEETKKPLKALLITGGCCHDYAYQSRRLVEGSKARTHIEWTVLQDPRKGTQGKIELYDDAAWAEPYDVVVHNECFANTKDPEYIRKITSAHEAGVAAVVIHCAMHTYRGTKIDDWRELLGVTSRRHEHQSEYTVVPVLPSHPVLQGFPKEWKTPRDELYVIEKIWPKTRVLATAKSERDGRSHAVFWVSQYGEARVFGTTFGHGSKTFDDEVFLDTVTRGLLWSVEKLTKDGKPAAGYESRYDWTRTQVARLPKSERPVELFNGKDLSGWTGMPGLWSVESGAILGKNADRVATSTYLFTEKKYRQFRLLLEVKQTRSPKHSTMHSAVAALGQRFNDKDNDFGFKGPLLMCCDDWGIWDAYRRNRVEPAKHRGQFRPKGVENVGGWNRIEILVTGNRIRFVGNGRLVFDFTDKPEMLRSSAIGLQLHSNGRPQEFRFRGLVLTEKPEDRLITVEK